MTDEPMGDQLRPCEYVLADGRTLHVGVELGQWSAWVDDDEKSFVNGYPLEGVLTEAVGLSAAHDELPEELAKIAEQVRDDIPRNVQPTGFRDALN